MEHDRFLFDTAALWKHVTYLLIYYEKLKEGCFVDYEFVVQGGGER